MNLLMVFLGGGLGAVSRYLLSRLIYSHYSGGFPLGTLVINLTGCLVIGFLGGISERWAFPPHLRLFVFIGILGGYTTFSSFGLETITLIRGGEWQYAVSNILISNLGGLALVFGGFVLGKFLAR